MHTQLFFHKVFLSLSPLSSQSWIAKQSSEIVFIFLYESLLERLKVHNNAFLCDERIIFSILWQIAKWKFFFSDFPLLTLNSSEFFICGGRRDLKGFEYDRTFGYNNQLESFAEKWNRKIFENFDPQKVPCFPVISPYPLISPFSAKKF